MRPHKARNEVDVIEGVSRPRKGHLAFDLNQHYRIDTAALESYAFAQWEPVLYDAMVVAAAIEYSDRIVKRSDRTWARNFSLHIPVHEPARWSHSEVLRALRDAVGFLTGDYWDFTFSARKGLAPRPEQPFLNIPANSKAVLAYSDGMDSCAVAGILQAELGNRLVRVRIGNETSQERTLDRSRQPFTAIPYKVVLGKMAKEPSARNRGFKFALISAIAAYLTNANEIVIPESGQGVFGPVLASVGHSYPDYRSHPMFSIRMERFVLALLGKSIRYIFPRLWYTKGETLKELLLSDTTNRWRSTRSCWRSNQWSSVENRRIQCGVCAACMLRRLSVHSAGQIEDENSYICSDLNATTLQSGTNPSFTKINQAFHEYAKAGVLHLDQIAMLADEGSGKAVHRHARLVSEALNLAFDDVAVRMVDMFKRHSIEWNSYIDTLGNHSFVKRWVRNKDEQ